MKRLMACFVALATLFVPALRAQTAAPAAAAPVTAAHEPGDISGTWQGTLEWAAKGDQPAGKLRIVVKIARKDGGGWSAVDYSIDQNPRGMNCSDVTLKGATFRYTIPSIEGIYEGQLSPDGNSMVGTWTQGGALPLTYVRATKETAWDIPEPPKPPTPMAADADPSFDVATIKPSDPNVPGDWFRVNGRNFTTHNISLAGMMKFAYGIHGKQIVSGPDWMDKDTFDIAAVPDAPGQPNDKQWKTMLQKLMAERFKLTFHHEQRELPVFALTVSKDGAKNMDENTGGGPLPSLFFRGTPGGIMLPAKNATMKDFTGLLQEVVLDKPVVDQTGLKGRYDFTLKWAPDDSQFGGHGPPPSDDPSAPPSLFTAVQEQVGLKLDSTKATVDVLVIDHAEKPTPN
jgi:uncharacterized protein (TIGR03435 family)